MRTARNRAACLCVAALSANLAAAEPAGAPSAAEERLRAAKLDDGGEITLVERRGNALRVAFTLAPTPASFIRCELGLPAPDKWDGRLWGFGNGGWAGAGGEPSGAGLVGAPIGLDAKIVDWVERGVPPGALSFKWNHEPKVLVVTPHPDCTVACEDAPASN